MADGGYEWVDEVRRPSTRGPFVNVSVTDG